MGRSSLAERLASKFPSGLGVRPTSTIVSPPPLAPASAPLAPAPLAPAPQVQQPKPQPKPQHTVEPTIISRDLTDLSSLFSHLPAHLPMMIPDDARLETIQIIHSLIKNNPETKRVKFSKPFLRSLITHTKRIAEAPAEIVKDEILDFILWLDKLTVPYDMKTDERNSKQLTQRRRIFSEITTDPDTDKRPHFILDCVRLYYGVRFASFEYTKTSHLRVFLGPNCQDYPIELVRELAAKFTEGASVRIQFGEHSGKVEWINGPQNKMSLRVPPSDVNISYESHEYSRAWDAFGWMKDDYVVGVTGVRENDTIAAGADAEGTDESETTKHDDGTSTRITVLKPRASDGQSKGYVVKQKFKAVAFQTLAQRKNGDVRAVDAEEKKEEEERRKAERLAEWEREGKIPAGEARGEELRETLVGLSEL